jgi:hypothetical protein
MHQKMLDNFSQTLFDLIIASLDSIKLPSMEENRGINTRYHLERGLVFHYYKQDSKSKEEFIKAQECSRFTWNLTGALGKRTKFQQFDVSQLVVMASSYEDSGSIETKQLPQNQDLNDDTLLEKIKFTDAETDKKQGNLQVVDQCILLAFCLNVKNTNPADGLTTEEMLPYVGRVLEHPNNWMVYTMGLLLRYQSN